MASSKINREAGDKAKGPRLQRMRCVLLIFQALEKSEKAHIYAAVEHKEDVIVKEVKDGTDYLEQNKNFNPATTFTFNSPEVLNTLVGFCDLWLEYAVKKKEVSLGFYATKQIGQEQITQFMKSASLKLPNKPILELLQTKDFEHPDLIPTCKGIILKEYKSQYEKMGDMGFLSDLEKWTNKEWKEFFSTIDWNFGEINEVLLKEVLLEKIKACRYYNHTLKGREELILSRLLDLLDEKQCMSDVLGKFINMAEVQLIFRQIGPEAIDERKDDPVYKIWETLKPPEDKRSIIDKLRAACSEINSQKLAIYARRASAGRITHTDKELDKSFLSLRYRIYEKCESNLLTYLETKKGMPISESEIDALFVKLNAEAQEWVKSLTTDFSYSMKSPAVVEGIILELFDSCYLALN